MILFSIRSLSIYSQWSGNGLIRVFFHQPAGSHSSQLYIHQEEDTGSYQDQGSDLLHISIFAILSKSSQMLKQSTQYPLQFPSAKNQKGWEPMTIEHLSSLQRTTSTQNMARAEDCLASPVEDVCSKKSDVIERRLIPRRLSSYENTRLGVQRGVRPHSHPVKCFLFVIAVFVVILCRSRSFLGQKDAELAIFQQLESFKSDFAAPG